MTTTLSDGRSHQQVRGRVQSVVRWVTVGRVVVVLVHADGEVIGTEVAGVWAS